MNTFMQTAIQKVRLNAPLIHHITNYVTVNDCANITLAIGASPIMADDAQEVLEITTMSNALVLNIGTLNERTIVSMLLAGKKANELGIPIILDPVGAGASRFRNETVKKLLNDIHFSVIRGNISEMCFLAGLKSSTKGVDASLEDIGKENEVEELALSLASSHQCITAITGKTDIVSDGIQTIQVKNGCSEMSRITGTGCMLTSLIASFCGSCPNSLFESTTSAVIAMGIAGELSYEKSKELGTSSFRMNLIDEISKMSDQKLVQRGKYFKTKH